MAALCRLSARFLSRTQNNIFNGFRAASSGGDKKSSKDVYEEIDTEKRVATEAFFQEKMGHKERELTRSEIMDQLGHLTGDQRYEMLENIRGNTDPFDVGIHRHTAGKDGTVSNPVLVPSATGERLIGCVCEEDSFDIKWMLLHNNEKKQCDCGNWFQMVVIEGASGGHH